MLHHVGTKLPKHYAKHIGQEGIELSKTTSFETNVKGQSQFNVSRVQEGNNSRGGKKICSNEHLTST